MARSDQPVRRATSACRLLHREQPDGALDIGFRAVGGSRVFADKAAGYGIPGITIDGTDPDAGRRGIHVGRRSRACRRGPALIELVSMRMSGHAHHDDMLFLGKEPALGWEYPQLSPGAYADPICYSFWAATRSDRHLRDATRGRRRHRCSDVERYKQEARALVETGSAGGHRGAMAGAAGGGHARVRRRLDPAARRSARTGVPPCHRS